MIVELVDVVVPAGAVVVDRAGGKDVEVVTVAVDVVTVVVDVVTGTEFCGAASEELQLAASTTITSNNGCRMWVATDDRGACVIDSVGGPIPRPHT